MQNQQDLKPCSTCEHGENNSGYCLDCYAGFKYTEKQCESKKAITNYDRIRNKSIEEFAEFLESTNNSLAIKLGGEYIVRGKDYIKMWLESEVTE